MSNYKKIPDKWLETKGEGITIAVIDTGYSPHDDLKKSVIQKTSILQNTTWEDLSNGHGNMCMGIIGARKENENGVMGVAPLASIVSIKSIGDGGSTEYKDLTNGIYLAVALGADVISISAGGHAYNRELEMAVGFCYERNIPIICPAGNDGHIFGINMINYPARFKETICVGSIDDKNRVSEFSSAGIEIDFVANGENIRSTYLNNTYSIQSGTSFSAPYVAGVVALLLAKHRKQEKETGANDCKTVSQIKEHIRTHTIDLGEVGKDSYYGHGVIDVRGIANKNLERMSFLSRLKLFFTDLFC